MSTTTEGQPRLCDSLDRLVATLRSSDLATAAIDDLVRELRPYMAGVVVQAPQFKPGMLLFRGRLCDMVASVRELTYPPAELTEIGRANRPRRPLFYASPSRSAVFFELPVKEGALLLVSRWRTRMPMLLNHVGYHVNIFEELDSNRRVAGWDGKTSPHDMHLRSEPVLNQLGQLFTERVPDGQEFRYKLSAAVAECMFGTPVAGILYPSIAMWANADNVALQPTWADANLDLVGVEAIRVNSIDGTKLHVNVVDYATSSNGKDLDWKGRGPIWQLKEQGETLKVESTGEIWQAFDEEGKEVDPS